MPVIRTPEDWWSIVDARWSDIVEIFCLAGAPWDEHKWSDGIGKPVTTHDETFGAMLERFKAARDHENLARWFNLAWIAAPDNRSIHSWPSWGAFCDLCSETWVFDEEGERVD